MPRVRVRKWGVLALAAGLAWWGGCDAKPGAGSPPTLRVLAAASLADSFREVGAAFEGANPGVRVEFSFGGSNQLRSQLEGGGPGDVFASADRKQMDLAVTAKVVAADSVRLFARNSLVLIVPKENRAGIGSLADLARPGLKIVVADGAVPAGNYTRLMLAKAGEPASLGPAFAQGVEANIVSREENVAALVAKVALGEADAGFAYASDGVGGNGPKISVIALPPGLEQQAEYVVAVTSRTEHAAAAAGFADFLLSAEARGILERRGFSAPGAGTP